MSELVEEDVDDECTRAPMDVTGGIYPPDLAIVCLIYSISLEAKEITRQI
jgi:hypothetical protein